MANPSPPSKPSIILLVLHVLLTTTTTAPSNVPLQELETVREVLTNHGYILFTNAIATSDLQYQILTTPTNTSAFAATEEAPTSIFTMFAPTDELLFALDMSSDANAYIRTLKYHVIPNRRHTFSDLKTLTSPFLETLLPHYSVLIGKTRDGDVVLPDNATVGVMVDGIRLNRPDLFLGPRLAVHGIDGILLTGLNLTINSTATMAGRISFRPPDIRRRRLCSRGILRRKGLHLRCVIQRDRILVGKFQQRRGRIRLTRRRQGDTHGVVGAATAGCLGGTAVIVFRICRFALRCSR
ncbi:hypothetical protein OROGR_006056 [Orobanche gracilis]